MSLNISQRDGKLRTMRNIVDNSHLFWKEIMISQRDGKMRTVKIIVETSLLFQGEIIDFSKGW